MASAVDLDGNQRIMDAVVDMGAYEMGSVIPSLSPTHYVSLSGAHIAPFTTWSTAATNIQAAIDLAEAGDTVLVNNGTYASGGVVFYGSMTNRIAITKPITVRSVNGPQVTAIVGVGPFGDAAVRCAYMGSNACLSGFTLTHGSTRADGDQRQEQSGGGVWCESTSAVLSNCVLTGNTAYSGGYGGGGGGVYQGTLYNCTLTHNTAHYGDGGGAYSGTLYHCTLTGNSAYIGGGGSYDSTLYHCTLVSNSAAYGGGGGAYGGTLYNCTLMDNYGTWGGGGARSCTLYNCTLTGNSAGGNYGGGGASYCTLYNCIVYYNTAPSPCGNDYFFCTLNYCCTTPYPGGTGNITNEPMFVDLAAGNLRLLSNSPCINAGTNQDWMIGAMDLDGNPRIYGGGRVDMGAYEYQGSLSVIPTNWLAQYGLPIDGSADHEDADGDGMNNWQEWRCNTDPTNGTSFLHFTTSALEENGVCRALAERGGRAISTEAVDQFVHGRI